MVKHYGIVGYFSGRAFWDISGLSPGHASQPMERSRCEHDLLTLILANTTTSLIMMGSVGAGPLPQCVE